MRDYASIAGFTLIEALVAIAVVVAAALGPMALLSRVISAAPHSEFQAAAIALAREPIAYLAHLRDKDFEAAVNYLTTTQGRRNPGGFRSSFASVIQPCLSTTCRVDPIEEEVTPCAPDTTCRLWYAPGGFFTHRQAGANPTDFSRWITVQRKGDNAYWVTVYVRFQERGKERTISVERAIYPFAQAAVELYESLLSNP